MKAAKQPSLFMPEEKPPGIPKGCPVPPSWPPPADWWDLVLVACSNGFDSRILGHQALCQFSRDHIVFIYNLLGNEHPGSPYEVAEWCRAEGVPLIYTWKDAANKSCYGLTIPAEIEALYETYDPAYDAVANLAEKRGMWPGGGSPICTSTFKRDPTDVLIRGLANGSPDFVARQALDRKKWPGSAAPVCTDRAKIKATDSLIVHLPEILAREAGRILLLTGERADESASRAKKPSWQIRGSTAPTLGRLVLWNRRILRMTDAEAIEYLRRHQIPLPASYGLGFRRHSCVNCIWQGFEEACLSASLYPWPMARRVAVEEKTGHRVNLNYRYTDAAGTEHIGYRAVWEFVYGPWADFDGSVIPAIRSEAAARIEAWHCNGKLNTVPEGIPLLPVYQKPGRCGSG